MTKIIESAGGFVAIEVEGEGTSEFVELKLAESDDLPAAVRKALDANADTLIFERDQDEPIVKLAKGRSHMRLVLSKNRKVEVSVRYEHETKMREFAPSATVFKVLQWAISKKGYNLDPVTAAKANLILPGADEPMPRERTIGSYVARGDKTLTVDLTLRDFTNG